MKYKAATITAVILLLLVAAGALYGGGNFINDPSGAGMNRSTAYLVHSPFTNFLAPGLVLFVVTGLFSSMASIAVIKKDAALSFIYNGAGGHTFWMDNCTNNNGKGYCRSTPAVSPDWPYFIQHRNTAHEADKTILLNYSFLFVLQDILCNHITHYHFSILVPHAFCRSRIKGPCLHRIQ